MQQANVQRGVSHFDSENRRKNVGESVVGCVTKTDDESGIINGYGIHLPSPCRRMLIPVRR